MSALEDTIMNKVRKLDAAKQQQLLRIIEDMEPKPFEFETWMASIESLHAQLKADNQLVSVQDMLDAIREEASWPRW